MIQHFRQKLRPWFGSAVFYRGALAVMLPVMVQQLINTLFNMIDNLMVGTLDMEGLSMSAVSVANKPSFIFNSFLFGLAGAGGLLISQYFGARDRKTCLGLYWLQMGISLLNGLAFFALMFFLPEAVMRIFVTDPRTVALGVKYLRIVSFSYLPASISGVCIFSLRSLGHNRTSMLVSLGSMAVNAGCNTLLIFGLLGFPRLGVEGAALGTLIARLFEMAVYVSLIFRRRMYFTFEPSACLRLGHCVRGQFTRKALPLITNELLYSVGLNIFFWCFARLDERAIPALAIAELCFQVSAVVATGNSSAVSVLIGTALGAGELDKARENTKKLFTLTIILGFGAIAFCCGLAFLLPQFYNISAELRRTATLLSCVMASFAPVNFAYAFCFFCLRAGGDTRAATLLDSSFLWALPVPASLLMGWLLPGRVSMLTAVLIVYLLQNLRVVPGLIVLRKGHWVRNITMENTH